MTAYYLLLLHLLGDYVLQSDWMAQEKTKAWWPAFLHALTYTIPFTLLFGFQWEPLVLIGGTHFAIDHWRLARYVCWAKNFPAPKAYRYSWTECFSTGYPQAMPAWLSVWLLIITDNAMHLALNGLAWHLWG